MHWFRLFIAYHFLFNQFETLWNDLSTKYRLSYTQLRPIYLSMWDVWWHFKPIWQYHTTNRRGNSSGCWWSTIIGAQVLLISSKYIITENALKYIFLNTFNAQAFAIDLQIIIYHLPHSATKISSPALTTILLYSWCHQKMSFSSRHAVIFCVCFRYEDSDNNIHVSLSRSILFFLGVFLINSNRNIAVSAETQFICKIHLFWSLSRN